jgi:hypothetical protein
MSTEEATYLLAHENGLKIDKYLSREEVAQIRSLHRPSSTSGSVAPSKRASTTSGKSPQSREIRFPSDFRTTNLLLPPARLQEALQMARTFPLLYVLENSIRELIKRVMAAKYGSDWWNIRLTSGRVKNVFHKSEERLKKEAAQSWHQRRGAHPIDYVDLKDLEPLILGNEALFFPDIIPDREWFVQFMKELEPSRNVVCHMNPLSDHNIADVKLRVEKWENVLKNAAIRIPQPE